MTVTSLAINILAVWRISSLLVREDGPYDLLARLRDTVGVRFDDASRPYGANVVAAALTCVWCTSVWAGLLVALAQRRGLVDALAYSAGAIVIERWVKR